MQAIGIRETSSTRRCVDAPHDSSPDADASAFYSHRLGARSRQHALTERRGFSRDFEARIATLRANVARLSDDEIIAELLRLTVTLGDGHSNL